MSNLEKVPFILFILFSIWLIPVGSLDNVIAGRLVFADIFGVAAISMVLLKSKFRVDSIVIFYFIFIFCLFLGSIFSINTNKVLFEILIHTFLGLIYLSFITIFKTEKDFDLLIYIFSIAGLIASLVGIFDSIAFSLGLRTIVPIRTETITIGASTFRNYGQAGTYVMMVICVIIPYRLLGTYKNLGKFKRSVIDSAIVSCCIFLLIASKVAAIIGVLVGITLTIAFQVFKRKSTSIVTFTIIMLSLISFILLIDTYAPDVSDRVKNRVRIKLEGEMNEGSFTFENWNLALKAFEDNPVFGTGLGAFEGSYSEYEVHSTYLKMLGETGLIGFAGYLLFVLATLKPIFSILRKKNINCRYDEYVVKIVPFLVGCFVSFIYTYHLRKREFWIMLIIVSLACKLSRRVAHLSNNKLSRRPLRKLNFEIA